MLGNALWVKEIISIFQLDTLFKNSAFLQVVVEAQNLDTIRCLSVPLDR